jgi:hypothetical protein
MFQNWRTEEISANDEKLSDELRYRLPQVVHGYSAASQALIGGGRFNG